MPVQPTSTYGLDFISNLQGVSAANRGRIRYNSGTQQFEVSENGGAYVPLLVAGSVTLQQAYLAGGAGPQVIQLDALRLGIEILDLAGGIHAPLFSVRDSTAAVKYLDIDAFNNLATIALPMSVGGSMSVGGNIVPNADSSFNLGDPTHNTGNRWLTVAALNYNSDTSPMGFSSAFLTAGTNPAYIWDLVGDVEANLLGPLYRFRAGSDFHNFIDFTDLVTGAEIQGYQAGAARGIIRFNNLGITIDGAGSTGNLLPANDNTQTLGGASNRWATVFGVAFNAEIAQMSFSSALANGATPAYLWDTVHAFTGISNKIYVWQTGGQPVIDLAQLGSSGPVIQGYDSSGSPTSGLHFTPGVIEVLPSNGGFQSSGNAIASLGSAGRAWGAFFSAQSLNFSKRNPVADADFNTDSNTFYVGYTSIGAPHIVSGLTPNTGQWIIIKDESGNASNVNTITFTPGSGNIDGLASKVVVNSPFGVARVYFNGTDWFTV